MGDFIDSFASILDRQECMGAKIEEDLSAVMLLSSMNGRFESTGRSNKDTRRREAHVGRRVLKTHRGSQNISEQASRCHADGTRDNHLRIL
jgi:hypothetical protein